VETLREVIEGLHTTTVKIAAEQEVMPTFFAFSGEGEEKRVDVIGTGWGNNNEKMNILRLLKIFFAAKGVTRYVMVSESWKACASTGDENVDRREPRLREDRQEILHYIGVEPGLIEFASCDVLRDSENNRSLSPLEFAEEGEFGGLMTELLPPEGMPKLPPEVARKIIEEISNLLNIDMQAVEKPH
jgi:hypothetical protein